MGQFSLKPRFQKKPYPKQFYCCDCIVLDKLKGGGKRRFLRRKGCLLIEVCWSINSNPQGRCVIDPSPGRTTDQGVALPKVVLSSGRGDGRQAQSIPENFTHSKVVSSVEIQGSPEYLGSWLSSHQAKCQDLTLGLNSICHESTSTRSILILEFKATTWSTIFKFSEE